MTIQDPIIVQEQHIYHHYDDDKPRISVEIEKNTKGYNHKIAISGAKSVDEVLALIADAQAKLLILLNPPVEVPAVEISEPEKKTKKSDKKEGD